MKKPKRPPRARTVQRKIERSHAKIDDARERLAELEPGGSAERPIDVESASLVEPRAESMPCLRCEGRMACEEHVTESAGGELLRVARLRCRACGARRSVYFRIRPTLLN